MKKKKVLINGIKSYRCYTIPEAATLVRVSGRTIRQWIKNGLPAMTDERPTLVRGDDLIAFIKARRAARKTKVAADAFYCLKCRAARKPAAGLVECQCSETRAKLSAFCNICETMMYKPIALSRLPEMRHIFDLSASAMPPDLPSVRS